MIALIMFLLLYFGKNFGMSSNLRTFCTICGAGKSNEFFNFDWKTQQWNLMVSAGAIIGGALAAHFLSTDSSVAIHPDTITKLQDLNINSAGVSYLPEELFSMQALMQPKVLLILSIGGTRRRTSSRPRPRAGCEAPRPNAARRAFVGNPRFYPASK